VWGIAGLFLAMPLMAALKAICMQVEGWQGWGHLMGSGAPVELKIDEPEVEKARLAAIEKALGSDAERTVVMDPADGGKEDARAGDTKSEFGI
ncbi:MAG: hypothetical protein K2V38_28445, partial [Gemmataceae bacterium]|nr:hypothetical protein [Gemmataceae bacterium]